MRTAGFLHGQFLPFALSFLSAASMISCLSSADSQNQLPSPSQNHASKQLTIPDGWIGITERQKDFPGEMRLVRNDNAASMIVRKLRPLASARDVLAGEDVGTLGNISMQNKLGNGDNQRRILRHPSVIG